MKKIITIVPLVLMVIGCGPSLEDKIRIAESTCAVILETRKFESSKRIELLNKAREQVGDYDGPYPMSDDFLWSSYSLGGKQACINDIVKPPPPTMAEIEAERERQKALEEIRKKREEEERIAAEEAAKEAAKEAAEKEKYISENTNSTHLYCPSKKIEIKRENVIDPLTNQYEYKETVLGPEKYAFVEINKIDGDNEELNGYLEPRLYFNIPREGLNRACYSDSAFLEKVGGQEFCVGETFNAIKPIECDYLPSNKTSQNSSSYGNSVLTFHDYSWSGGCERLIGSAEFLVDRVNLIAAENVYDFEDSRNRGYQCEIVTEDVFTQKLNEIKNRVESAAEKERATLEKIKAESAPKI